MTVRLTLVCAAAGSAVREARFGDGPLDERARREALASAPAAPAAQVRCCRAPSVRCRETAEVWGVDAVVETALRDCDFGSWTGRTPQEVISADPQGFRAWMSDADAVPHGGESVRELHARVGGWLRQLSSEAVSSEAGGVLAVVEPSAVRAAVVHALDAPLSAFWRIDVPPLSSIALTGRSGRWNLRLGATAAN
ncbi:histidine phosphatase family protein [Streptomyces sp. NPDC057445]|uniref:histidine phosphatase family protein n=1 Tax=Streptomyces sp. NPDC057445 TaxID=3346136 RepID=UPI0036B6F0EF